MGAFKANENKKLMDTEGLRDRLGSVGNQFAITMINSFLFCLVLMFITEGKKFGAFLTLCKTSKKTSAVTQSVANTAKRVIVIVGVAIVLGESLDPLKLIGCGIGIGGVFLYSVIDDLVKPKA